MLRCCCRHHLRLHYHGRDELECRKSYAGGARPPVRSSTRTFGGMSHRGVRTSA